MGKTPKPLVIVVTDPKMLEWEEIQAYKAQNHLVEYIHIAEYLANYTGRTTEGVDLILGPDAWMMDQDHRPYLKLAIEAGRAKRYPKGGEVK